MTQKKERFFYMFINTPDADDAMVRVYAVCLLRTRIKIFFYNT